MRCAWKAGLLAATFLTACSDVPTGVDAAPEPPPDVSATALIPATDLSQAPSAPAKGAVVWECQVFQDVAGTRHLVSSRTLRYRRPAASSPSDRRPFWGEIVSTPRSGDRFILACHGEATVADLWALARHVARAQGRRAAPAAPPAPPAPPMHGLQWSSSTANESCLYGDGSPDNPCGIPGICAGDGCTEDDYCAWGAERDENGVCQCTNSGDYQDACWEDPDDPSAGGDGEGDGGTGGGSGDGGGAGGGTTIGGEDPEEECDPTVPGCVLPLRPEDIELIMRADEFLRTEFTTRQAEIVCRTLWTKVVDMFNAGDIKRGNRNIPDGQEQHGAAYWQGEMHIDQNYLDAANSSNSATSLWYRKWLTGTLMHEAAHALGESHPVPSTDPNWMNTYPFYHTNNGTQDGQGVEQCTTSG